VLILPSLSLGVQAILVDYGINDNHHSMNNYGFAHDLPGYSFLGMEVEMMGRTLKYKLEKTKGGAAMLQHMLITNHVLLHRGTNDVDGVRYYRGNWQWLTLACSCCKGYFPRSSTSIYE
jgi:hypothetical protein